MRDTIVNILGVVIILLLTAGLFALTGGWAVLIIVFLMFMFRNQLSGR